MTTKSTFFIASFVLIFTNAYSGSSKDYLYVDGNNNEYRISMDSLYYNPITPIESSSGEYSGGNPKQVKITTAEYTQIESIIQAIKKDKPNHSKTRQMGMGTLVFGKKRIYVQMNATLKIELENLLKELLNK
jgi:hypothetical protein